ncbi:MAG: DUF4919 domain-containing protein [Muribaculaceae bacterium]
MKKFLTILFTIFTVTSVVAQPRTSLSRPDLEAIRVASLDEESPYYYPRLLTEFMKNDTTMSDVDFQYFYYGTFFQEDYDPYRQVGNPDQLAVLAPLFNKTTWTRSERKQILDFAMAVLADNPVNLRQLTNRIFVYQQNGKNDLAKIWQYKLNHLLKVIASSGNGLTPETAWVVVYPHDEYDFLNISGITAREQEFVAPYYDHILINRKDEKQPEGYYFDIEEILKQYFIKHPSEI